MALRNYARVLSSKCLSSFRAHKCFVFLKTEATNFYASNLKKKILHSLRHFTIYKREMLMRAAFNVHKAVSQR